MRAAEPVIADLGRVCGAWIGGRPWPAGVDPEAAELAALASEHRVLPLLHDLLGRDREPAAPALRRAARLAWLRTGLHGEAALALAGQAIGLLARASIPVLPLKGVDLAPRLYGSAALRPMDDVDLLVPPDRVEAALVGLEKGGIRLLAPGRWRGFGGPHFHLALRSDRSPVRLELHWQLLDAWRRAGLGSELVQAEAARAAGRPDLGPLGAELTLLHLALHADKHSPFLQAVLPRRGAAAALSHPGAGLRLLWLVDVALACRVAGLDPLRLAEIARCTGTAGTARAVLDAATALLGPDSVPPAVISALAPAERRGLGRAGDRAIAALLGCRLRPVGAVLAWAGRPWSRLDFRPIRLLDLPFRRPAGPGAGSSPDRAWRP